MKGTSYAGLIMILLGITSPQPLHAQGQGTGSIEGVLSDASGAVIPGVEVTVRNLGTNAARVAVTDDRGRYRADLLPPGDYEISTTQAGFSPAKVTLRLIVGTTSQADLKLLVAGQQQTVLVSGEAMPIDTSSTEVANTVGERAVQDLPINGRRWDNFVLLTPGVTNDGDYGLVSYRGISGIYNNNSIDGADNNQAFFSEARGRTRVVYTISQSSVREFQVGLSNFTAEFGRAAGGMVNAVTKSGTNEFHGEGFYYIRDKALMAMNPRAKALGQPKPEERRQQFGASAGGPLIRDQLFFFGNYDQQKRAFPGLVIPDVAFDTVACTVPGCAATIAFLNSLTGPFPRAGDNYIFMTKLDWIIDLSHTFTGSYSFHKWTSPNGIQTQPIITVSELANGTDSVRTDMLNLKLTSVVTPKIVNEFRFQYGRDFEFQTPNSPGPSVFFTGGISFGMPSYLPRSAYPDEKRFQYADNLSFIKGKHSMKAGLDINHVRELQVNLYNGGGAYSYSTLNALAMDCPAAASGCVPQNTGGSTSKHYNNYQQAFDRTNQAGRLFFTTTDWNFFLQDHYSVSRSVTLYLGLRYEYTTLPQPERGNPAFPLTTSFNKDTNNLGPRIGFSWDIGAAHKTALRGGYGMYYGRTSNSALASAMLNNGVLVANYYMTPTSTGAPLFPNVLPAPPETGASTSTINFFAADYARPVIHSMDLVLERELWRGFTISGSYLLSRGLRLPLFRDINLPAPTGTVLYTLPDGSLQGPFPLYLGARPDRTVGAQIISESVLNSTYNGFVLVVAQRFKQGVQFNSNLTIAKALDNGQTSLTNFSAYSQAFDPLNQKIEKGLSRFDVRKRWVSSFILAPSIDRLTGNKAARVLINDWQLGGILTFSDGKPLTSTVSGSLSSGIGASVSSTTNGSGGSNRVPWLAPGSYTATGLSTLDLRVTRRFKITEQARIEFIGEAFNLFNRVNYTSWQTIRYRVLSSTKTGSAANVVLGDFTTAPFLLPINVGNTLFSPRQLQLGLRFIW